MRCISLNEWLILMVNLFVNIPDSSDGFYGILPYIHKKMNHIYTTVRLPLKHTGKPSRQESILPNRKVW